MKHIQSRIIKLIKEQETENKRRERQELSLVIDFNRICKKIDKKISDVKKIPKVPKSMRIYYNSRHYRNRKKKLGNNALVYKITDNEETESYYGSTTKTLSERFKLHTSAYKKILDNTDHRYCTVYELFKKYGVDNCVISLVEQCNGLTKKELQERERFHINSNKCINKNLKNKPNRQFGKKIKISVETPSINYNDDNKYVTLDYKPKSDFEDIEVPKDTESEGYEIEPYEEESKLDEEYDKINLSEIKRYVPKQTLSFEDLKIMGQQDFIEFLSEYPDIPPERMKDMIKEWKHICYLQGGNM